MSSIRKSLINECSESSFTNYQSIRQIFPQLLTTVWLIKGNLNNTKNMCNILENSILYVCMKIFLFY